MADGFEFTVDWFSPHWPNWLIVTADRKISKILEIGSFEGRSAATMIAQFSRTSPLELYCIDNWRRDFEEGGFDMTVVEQRFDRNVTRAIAAAANRVTVNKCKGTSVRHMTALLANGHGQSFDLIFVDGSHEAPDVLCDMVLAYHLCATGGLIICDDYLWSPERHGSEDPLMTPRPAIDAFVGMFSRKVHQFAGLPIYQVYLRKTA